MADKILNTKTEKNLIEKIKNYNESIIKAINERE
jgi:hypothetical protein